MVTCYSSNCRDDRQTDRDICFASVNTPSQSVLYIAFHVCPIDDFFHRWLLANRSILNKYLSNSDWWGFIQIVAAAETDKPWGMEQQMAAEESWSLLGGDDGTLRLITENSAQKIKRRHYFEKEADSETRHSPVRVHLRHIYVYLCTHVCTYGVQNNVLVDRA